MDSNRSKIILAVAAGIFLFAIIYFLDRVLAVGILFFVFLIALSLFLFYKSNLCDKRILTVFFIAIFLHFLFVLFLHYSHFQPFGDGGGDYDGYHSVATEISTKLHHLDFSIGDALKWGHVYPLVMGYVYALTIPNMLIGQILNVFVVGFIAVLAYLLALDITTKERGSFLVGLIAIFYPSLLFYGSLMLKDAIVVLFLLLGSLFLIRLIKQFSWKNFVFLYISSMPLFNLRFYIGYALILSFLLFWFLFSNMAAKRRIFYGLLFFVVLGTLPYFSSDQGYWGIGNFQRYLNKDSITMYREYAYTAANTGGSVVTKTDLSRQVGLKNQNSFFSFLLNTISSSKKNGVSSSFVEKTDLDRPFLFVVNIFQSFFYTLLGPMPWQITTPGQFFALFETIPWYFILYIVFVGVIKEIKFQYKNILSVLSLSFLMLAVVSLFIANFGVITRIRMPAFVLLSCLLPFGLKKENKIYRTIDKVSYFFKKIFSIIIYKIKNTKPIFFVCTALYVSILITSLFLDKNLTVGIIIVTIFSIITLSVLLRSGIGNRKLCLLFIFVILIHFAATALIYYNNFYPFGGGAGDQEKYHQMATELSLRFRHGDFSIKGFDKIYPDLYVPHFYPVLLAVLYTITAPSIIIGESLNVWLVAVSIIFLYLLVKEIGSSDKNALFISLVATIYPSYLYFSSLLLRDAIIACFSVISLLLLLKIIKNFSGTKLIFLLLAIAVTLHFRFYIGAALLLVLLIFWYKINLDKKKKIVYGLIVLILVGFIIQFFTGQGYYGVNFFRQFLSPKTITFMKETAYKPIASNQGVTLGTGSSIIVKAGLDNPIHFIENTIISTLYVFLGPMPWQIRYSRQLIALVETVAWYFALIFIFFKTSRYLKGENYKNIFPLVVFAVIVFVVLGIYMDNFGSYMRVRVPAFLALLALADFSWLFDKLSDIKISAVRAFKKMTVKS